MGASVFIVKKMMLFRTLFFATSVMGASFYTSFMYDMAAEKVAGMGKDIVATIRENIENSSNFSQTTTIIEFEDALNTLSNAELVEILSNIPVDDILEDGLFAADFALIFEDVDAMAGIDFSTLNGEFQQTFATNNDTVEKFEEAMEALVHLVPEIQDIFNNEITVSSLFGVVTDVLDVYTRMEDVTEIYDITSNVYFDILFWTSLVAEKVIYSYSNYEAYLTSMEEAIETTKTQFEEIHVGMCDRDFDALDAAVNAIDFAGSDLIDTWTEAASETGEFWNVIVGNVPYILDWRLEDWHVDDIEMYIQDILDTIESFLVSTRFVLIPAKDMINQQVQNLAGC